MVDSRMSSDSLWEQDTGGVTHLSQAALLAFIREQCVANEKSRINEHLLTGCAACNQLHNELKQSCYALNHLTHMACYLNYFEVQPNQILQHMRKGVPLTSALTGKRKRKFQERNRSAARQQGYRTGLQVFRFSFPVAFGLLLLCTTVAIVLAYTIASFVPLPGEMGNHIYRTQSQPIIARHEQTPTPTVVPTMAPVGSGTVEPGPAQMATVPATKGLIIGLCSPRGYIGQALLICGSGFKAGDRISLVLELYGMRNPVTVNTTLPVDKHGKLFGWYEYSCANPPLAIYAKDETLMPATVVSNTLTHISIEGCHGTGPTPRFTPGGQG